MEAMRARSGVLLVNLCVALQCAALCAHAGSTRAVPADYPSIQAAIDAAQPGDVVIVAPGSYDENIDFEGKAVAVTSAQGPDVTVIDGGNRDSVVQFQTGEGPDSVLNGFTVQGGMHPFGACIRMQGASPTITGNVFEGATAMNGDDPGPSIGGSSASPVIADNRFRMDHCGAGLSGEMIFVNDSHPQLQNNALADDPCAAAAQAPAAQLPSSVCPVPADPLAADPNAFAGDTGALADPNAFAADPNALAADPNSPAGDPNAFIDPGAVAADPNAFADPNAVAADPNGFAADPNAFADPNACAVAADPNAFLATPPVAADPTAIHLHAHLLLFTSRGGHTLFRASGSFDLASQSNGVDPANEEVDFFLTGTGGPFGPQLAPGSFHAIGSRIAVFRAAQAQDGVRTFQILSDASGRHFAFRVSGEVPPDQTIDSTVGIGLQIGDDAGLEAATCSGSDASRLRRCRRSPELAQPDPGAAPAADPFAGAGLDPAAAQHALLAPHSDPLLGALGSGARSRRR